ncbi:hypothetical protein FRB94_001581 [Tulasnella sp. JGI-2019a]|nr:hypothetical protein FRB94_001581 [Tulasnella sp. JGI-2019a]
MSIKHLPPSSKDRPKIPRCDVGMLLRKDASFPAAHWKAIQERQETECPMDARADQVPDGRETQSSSGRLWDACQSLSRENLSPNLSHVREGKGWAIRREKQLPKG